MGSSFGREPEFRLCPGLLRFRSCASRFGKPAIGSYKTFEHGNNEFRGITYQLTVLPFKKLSADGQILVQSCR